MPRDPVRGQEVMQDVCGEGRGDTWGTRSTRRAHFSAGHLPFPVPLLAELPNSCFEAQERTGDRHGWHHKAWTQAQTYPESTARTEAASSFPQQGLLCYILVAKPFSRQGREPNLYKKERLHLSVMSLEALLLGRRGYAHSGPASKTSQTNFVRQLEGGKP